MARIADIEGIGPAYATQLRGVGITSTEKLLERAADRRGRDRLAVDTGLSPRRILEWVNRADLMRVRGVGSQYSDLLEAAGVDTVKELRNRNAENLTAAMVEANDSSIEKSGRSIVRRVPTLKEVVRWIDHARELPPVVAH